MQSGRAATAADPAATTALLHLVQAGAGAPTPDHALFDDADVSAAALGEGQAAWRDPGLGGVQLSGFNLDGVRLRRADLTAANLTKASLVGATCSGIVLRGACLEEASFRDADLIAGVLEGADAGEADFTGAFLEDARLGRAGLRFANLTDAVMDGADFGGADLWGARLSGVAADRVSFKDARMDEAVLEKADMVAADLSGASLRRARLGGAGLKNTVWRGAVLDGAVLDGADLTGAIMPHLSLAGCSLVHVRFAGAWLERTRMTVAQLGGACGEEAAGEFAAARDAYIVLEQNFRSLGNADDASWAFRKRRRMGKRMLWQQAQAAWAGGRRAAAAGAGLRWLADAVTEWICDYGESLGRVWRTFLTVLVTFAVIYWLSGCLEPRDAAAAPSGFRWIDYVLFSLDSMTTVGTSDTALKPSGQAGMLLASIETVVGTVLLGLFGFVLGGRMRNSS